MDKIRLVLGIIMAVSIGLLIDTLGLGLLTGDGLSNKTIFATAILNIVVVFLIGFISAFIAKQREMLVSFLAFFLANLFWAYYEIQGLREAEISFAAILSYIVFPFLAGTAVSLLGGFLAKKLNRFREKKTGD